MFEQLFKCVIVPDGGSRRGAGTLSYIKKQEGWQC